MVLVDMRRIGRAVIFVALFFCTTGFDQASKDWANHSLTPGVREPVVDGYWDWELAYNPGVAFSTFASFAGSTGMRVLLLLIAVAALVGISVLALRAAPEQRLKRVAYALVAGGALGNLIDRLRDGAVTDFVRWRIHDHRWPIFNLADAALLIGVVLLVIGGMRSRRAAPAG